MLTVRLRIPRGDFLFLPHHQHCTLSMGVFVLPTVVQLLVVSPFPFPVSVTSKYRRIFFNSFLKINVNKYRCVKSCTSRQWEVMFYTCGIKREGMRSE